MPLRPYLATAVIGWTILIPAGVLYARQKGVPPQFAVPLLAAFLIEFLLYLIPGFSAARLALETRLSKRRFAFLLWLSAFLPYLIYSVPTAKFSWPALALLAALTACVCFWYAVLRASPAADAAIGLIFAAAVLSRVFQTVFASPLPNLRIDVLGQLMLIRTGAMAMLSLRKSSGIGFGFVPNWFEVRIGVEHFLYFLPIGFPLAWSLGLIRWHVASAPLLTAVGTFLGILWVVALMEEFFFRGLLQAWIREWTGNRLVSLLTASVCFGLAHLGFRAFPNWRMALVSTVAGLVYGMAYERAGGIRASMVAHALVVTVWRTLFS